jgi:F0F1-type ATP synthase assembly protein I
MDLATGFGMLAMGLIAIMIGSLIIWKVINMVAKKEKEEKERKERDKIYGSN